MNKTAEQKALEAYPTVPCFGDKDAEERFWIRFGYSKGYNQALFDIKQRVEEIIEHQEKEWGKSNVNIGLYAILGHIVEIEEEL